MTKKTENKTIIITGAQFSNKGAQSLLFSFISEIKERLPNASILYFPLDAYDSYNQKEFSFKIVYQSEESHRYEQSLSGRVRIAIKYYIKKILKRQTISLDNIKALHNAYKNADVLVDLSGYQLSSEWSLNINKQYLRYLQEAERHSIPIVLFPQSFGPFEYGENQGQMDKLIRTTLEKVKIVYVREQDGYDLLTKRYHLKNVKLLQDFVLQCPEPNIKNIYRNSIAKKAINKPAQGSVAVIPNFQNFDHGDYDQVMKIYRYIINSILKKNRNIVIFRHSADLDICREIYSYYKNDTRVMLNEQEFSCIEYSDYISNFDYIVAARYHAIVHSYKATVPAIILGWAIKYQELSKIFGQEYYLVNTSVAYDERYLSEIVNSMDNEYKNESTKIKNRLESLKSGQCIDAVVECMS